MCGVWQYYIVFQFLAIILPYCFNNKAFYLHVSSIHTWKWKDWMSKYVCGWFLTFSVEVFSNQSSHVNIAHSRLWRKDQRLAEWANKLCMNMRRRHIPNDHVQLESSPETVRQDWQKYFRANPWRHICSTIKLCIQHFVANVAVVTQLHGAATPIILQCYCQLISTDVSKCTKVQFSFAQQCFRTVIELQCK